MGLFVEVEMWDFLKDWELCRPTKVKVAFVTVFNGNKKKQRMIFVT